MTIFRSDASRDGSRRAEGERTSERKVRKTLALAIDPYAVGPEAERVRKEVLSDEAASGPFAALAALKKD